MAKAVTKPKPPAKPQQLRDYVVVQVGDNGGLTLVDAHVSARRQEEACDLVVAKLPEEERNGVFAAFLAGSYREFEYETKPTFVTSKKARVAANGAAPENPSPEETTT